LLRCRCPCWFLVPVPIFAGSPEARWSGNFRELSASVTRRATLSDGGWINEENVAEEIVRLRKCLARFGLDWSSVMG
jgi:transcriptional regulatory protein RtcR